MIMAHVHVYWMVYGSRWLTSIKFTILNIGGTSQFNYIAGIGFGLSWAAAEAKNCNNRDLFWQSMSRTLIMIVLSFFYNILALIVRGTGWAGLWAWNILQSIAFSRFFGTFLMWFSRKARLVWALIQVAAAGAVTYWMVPRYMQEGEVAAQTVFYLFFNPIQGDGLLVFFPFFIIGTIVGEGIHQLLGYQKGMQAAQISQATQNTKTNAKEAGNKLIPIAPESIHLVKTWLAWGVGLFIAGIIIGLRPEGEEMDFYQLIRWANLHPTIDWETLPLFLLPNSYAWSLYCMGFHLILTSLFVYYIDLCHRSPRPWRMLYTFGRYSLTIYFTHYFFLVIPMLVYPNLGTTYITIWIVIPIFFAAIWTFCEWLDRKYKGKGSLEYVIGAYSAVLYEKIMKIPLKTKPATRSRNEKQQEDKTELSHEKEEIAGGK